MRSRLPLAALAAALASGCAPSGANDSDLDIAVEPTELVAGDFVVAVLDDRLEITHPGRPDSPVWSTVPGRPFLSAARGEADYNYSRGSFFVEDEREAACRYQTVDAAAIDEGDGAVVIRGALSGCGGASLTAAYEVRFSAVAGRRLAMTARLLDAATDAAPGGLNRLALRYATEASERFYGFGAQYSELDLKGKTLPIWSQEQGHGRGLQPITGILNSIGGGAAGSWHTSYTAVPFYLTNTGRGVVVTSTEYLSFDLDRVNEVVVDIHAAELSAQIIAASTAAEVIEAHTEHSGRMQPLPAWIGSGAILRVHGGSAAVRARLDEVTAAGAPVAAVWVEDWVGTRQTFGGTRLWWNWQLDESLYPDWAELIAELRGRGVRVLTYFNPFLADAAGRNAAARNLYAEAAERGYLVERADGSPYVIGQGGFDAALVDLFNPAAAEWLEAIMIEQLELGVSGWMNDFGEALPPDAVLSSGDDPLSAHNRYPERWAAIARSAIRAAGLEGDAVFFSRSGSGRSPGESTLFWLGDQLVTWDDFDGIKTVVKGLISSGLSGYALNHPDIGGYFSIDQVGVRLTRDGELFRRWVELAAFTAAFRTHDTNLPDDNHQLDSDPETLAHFAAMTRLFASLQPYRARLMREAAATGMPLVRHPALLDPADAIAWDLDAQFALGPDLIVAPVLDPGATSVEIRLPAGEWVHLFTGERHALDRPATLAVDAPLGTPAAFYRAGTPELESL